MAALWLALPELLDHAQLSRRTYSRKIHSQTRNVEKRVERDLEKAALNSPYKKYVPDFKFIKEEDYPI